MTDIEPFEPTPTPAAVVLPPYVASGELIESAWGNGVVNALAELNTRRGISVAGSLEIAAGQTANMLWQSYSTATWGPGPILTAPAGTSGLHIVSCTAEGPTSATGDRDVLIKVNATSYAGYIPAGKGLVAVAALTLLVAGDQVAVSVYNPAGVAAFYNVSFNAYQVAP